MPPSEDEITQQFMEELTSDEMKDEMRFVWDSVDGGLSDYDDPAMYSPAAKRDHTTAVSAVCRNAHIVARAKRAAVASQGAIQIRSKRGRVTFILKSHTEVWFKKLNDRGEPSLRPSQQSLEFVLPPMAQGTLPMMQAPEVNRFIAGYRANGTATDFAVVVSRPIGHGVFAQVDLKRREVVDLFVQPAAAQATAEIVEQVRQRVKIRRQAQEQADAQEPGDANKSIS